VLKRKLIILIIFFLGISILAAIPQKEEVSQSKNRQIQVQETITMSGFSTSPTKEDIPSSMVFLIFASSGILLLTIMKIKNRDSKGKDDLSKHIRK